MDLGTLARKIIKDNIYLTLATSDEEPWAAPVFYCIDDRYNFYFVSQLASLHIKHALKRPTVAFAIFDSHSEEGKGVGIQASGSVQMVEGKDLEEALKWYSTKFIELKPEFLRGKAPYRIFKITPLHVWVTDPKAKADRRTEIKLN